MPKAVKYVAILVKQQYKKIRIRTVYIILLFGSFFLVCLDIKSLRKLFYSSTPVCYLLFSIDDEIVFEHSGAGI